MHDAAPAAGRPLTAGLSDRVAAFLGGGEGAAASLVIVRDVLGIERANRHVADRIAVALLAADARFTRTKDGRWALAGVSAAAESPALDTCRFAVVDVETTGTRAWRGDRIIEIAVVTDGRVAFHSLVNPGMPIPPFVAALTGITDGAVREALPFDAVVDALLDALDGTVFVAHNARFDWAFVSAEVARARARPLQGPRLCTQRLARRLLPELPRRDLDTVAAHFGITIAGRHRAVGDAMAAARVLHGLLGVAKERGAVSLADLEKLRISDCGLRIDTGGSLAGTTLPVRIRNPQSTIRNPDP